MVEIRKSPQDKRTFKYLELDNGIKVALVFDPTAEKAAAALNVNVGHMSEPDDLPGLAHFCEHLLFMGTEKYPTENDYQKYISDHGGSSNAFTGTEHTQYFFDISAEFLEPALDRFAQFFLTPLFNPSSKDKEIKAVNSEHEKNIQSDIWRLYQLEKVTSKPSHPFGKFGTGNLETLGIRPTAKGLDVREELLKFHSKYYSANLMTLAVVSPSSIEQMEELVRTKFSQVENKNVARPYFPDHPYGPDQLCEKIFVVPVKDLRSLELLFPFPDQHPHYLSHPARYLSHLIGHEGENSILSYLKDKSWANSLSAGLGNNSSGFSMFRIHIELTQEGLEAVDSIIQSIFEYVEMLKTNGVQEWVFKECQALGEMQFLFKDKERPVSLASGLVSGLQVHPPEKLLTADYCFEVFDPQTISELTLLLNPRNVRIAIVSKKFEAIVDSTVEFYGTKYKREKIPESTLLAWSNVKTNVSLQLPPPNEFIPTDFSIKPAPEVLTASPVIIREANFFRVWHKQDDEFLFPKATAYFTITSPLAYIDPTHSVLTKLMGDLVKESLNEFAYSAEIAGIDYHISADFYGLVVKMSGYNHKLGVLAEKIFEKLGNLKIEKNRYTRVKETFERELKNYEADQAGSQAIYFTTTLLAEKMWTYEEKLSVIQSITLEMLQSFVSRFFSRIYIESLFYGNMTSTECLTLVDTIERVLNSNSTILPLLPEERLKYRCIEIPTGNSYFFEKNNTIRDISAVENYYQFGLEDMELHSYLLVLSQVLSEPCFNQLRTEEQLGYIVQSRIKHQNGVYGISIIVQSEKHPRYVDERIEAFLQKFHDILVSMKEEEFNTHISAVITKLTEKDKTIIQRSNRYWTEIYNQSYIFTRVEQQVAIIRKITLANLQGYFQKYLTPTSSERRKLSTHILGTRVTGLEVTAATQPEQQQHKNEEEQSKLEIIRSLPRVQICNVTMFKQSMSLHPLKKIDTLLSKL